MSRKISPEIIEALTSGPSIRRFRIKLGYSDRRFFIIIETSDGWKVPLPGTYGSIGEALNYLCRRMQ